MSEPILSNAWRFASAAPETDMIMTLALAAAQVDAPPVPAFFTGERLYEICRHPSDGKCSMYIAGVVDGVFLSELDAPGNTLCRAKLNTRDAARIVTDYLADHPGYLQTAAAAGVREAISTALTCDDKS
jgi:hypothetical protein